MRILSSKQYIHTWCTSKQYIHTWCTSTCGVHPDSTSTRGVHPHVEYIISDFKPCICVTHPQLLSPFPCTPHLHPHSCAHTHTHTHKTSTLTCCPISRKYPTNRCACSSSSPAAMAKTWALVVHTSACRFWSAESSRYGTSATKRASCACIA